MTQRRRSLVLALVFGLHAVPSSGQACSVRDFTFQDVERIDFSDVVRHAGFSIARQDRTEQKKSDFEGSPAIYSLPYTLKYDEARAPSDFMLRSSGLALSEDIRLDLVRTALLKTGAEMYKGCVATQSIQVAVPDAAYTQRNFDLLVSWTPTARAPEAAEFEIRVLGGRVQGKGGVAGTMKKGVAKSFDIERSTNGLLQIDVIVHGQAFPAVLLPPPDKAMAMFKTEKRVGKSQKPHSAPGNECGDQALLVSEEGTAAKAHSKSCRLCVDRSPSGFLLASSAETDGHFSGTGKVALEFKSPLQMCALFSVQGRGKKGGRQEVQNGSFYVWEMMPAH